MIKAVIFALGGVIVPLDFPRGYRELEKHCPPAAEDIPKRIGTTDLVPRFECGKIDKRDFHRELSQILDLSVDYDTFCSLWTSIFVPQSFLPVEWMPAIRKTHRLLLLSNTNQIHFEMIRENYRHIDHFDDFVLSYEVGVMKPNAPIYEEAIRKAGCKPEECFFTDDVMPYVEGARRAGIDAVQFQNAAQLKTALAERGIQLT